MGQKAAPAKSSPADPAPKNPLALVAGHIGAASGTLTIAFRERIRPLRFVTIGWNPIITGKLRWALLEQGKQALLRRH